LYLLNQVLKWNYFPITAAIGESLDHNPFVLADLYNIADFLNVFHRVDFCDFDLLEFWVEFVDQKHSTVAFKQNNIKILHANAEVNLDTEFPGGFAVQVFRTVQRETVSAQGLEVLCA